MKKISVFRNWIGNAPLILLSAGADLAYVLKDPCEILETQKQININNMSYPPTRFIFNLES